MPASSRCASTCSEMFAALPLTMLMTPGGSPASLKSSIRKCVTRSVCVAGLKTTVLPISAAAVGRLAAIDVKLNGLTAKTKPSRGRYSRRFQAVPSLYGCCPRSWSRKQALSRPDVAARRPPPTLTADLHRNFGPGVGQLGQARLEALAVGIAGRVGAHRFVDGGGDLEVSVGGHVSSWEGESASAKR